MRPDRGRARVRVGVFSAPVSCLGEGPAWEVRWLVWVTEAWGGNGSTGLQAMLASLCTSEEAELSRGWGQTVTTGPGWRLRAKMQDGQALDHNRWLDHGPSCSWAWSRAASGHASVRQQAVAGSCQFNFLVLISR